MKKTIYYAPRLLSILYCLFLMLFSFDVFEAGRSWTDMALGFFMHNIPVIILAVLSFFAWKDERVGMIGFGSMAVFLGLMVFSNMLASGAFAVFSSVSIIMGPALLISALYGYSLWHKKRNA